MKNESGLKESDVVEIKIKGSSVKEIRKVQQLTGKHEKEVDVVIAALRLYDWILAQQAAGGNIVAEFPKRSRFQDIALVNFLQDRKKAARHYRKYAIWPMKRFKKTSQSPSP